ncbi:MAG: S-layer homology domain-containing protein [Clostridia bacterium]|nr:S-layer homology domain-containing protein [Clostridia bacterium]
MFTENTFADVSKDDWYYDAVKYVYENNLMQGTDKGFEADSKMTRAMLVTVLYRLENPSEEIGECIFEDVSENAWYGDAVAWAAENDIVSGISETEFAPEDNVSREQMAMIFYRYAKFKGYNTEETSELSQFTDKAKISDWSLEALKWANAAEIISGTSDTEISPKDTATRGQVASILMRFCERIK